MVAMPTLTIPEIDATRVWMAKRKVGEGDVAKSSTRKPTDRTIAMKRIDTPFMTAVDPKRRARYPTAKAPAIEVIPTAKLVDKACSSVRPDAVRNVVPQKIIP